VSTTQERFQRLSNFDEGGLEQRRAGNQDYIHGLLREGWQKALQRSTQQTFGAIALHRFSQLPPGSNAHTKTGFRTKGANQNKKRVGIGLSLLPHPLKIGCPCQTKATLHLKTSADA